MPQIFQCQIPVIAEDKSREVISNADEQRLLDLAFAKNIEGSEIGSFFVILVSSVPYELGGDSYQIFSPEELIEQASVNGSMIYDPIGKRLIGFIPPTSDIVKGIANNESL